MKSFAHRSLAVVGAIAAAGGAVALTVEASGAFASGPAAHAARTVSLNDTGSLHKTGKKGFNLYESGRASGSISGSISLHLNVVGTNKVTAEMTVYPKGGSISGKASGNYRTNGGTATFSGTMSITHGSGGYSGAHGSGISFKGTVQRSNDAVTVHVSGKFSS